MAGKYELIDCISEAKPNAIRNEDCFFFTNDSAVVLDGATGLSALSFSPESDGNWFVNQFKFHAQNLKDKVSVVDNIEIILSKILANLPEETQLENSPAYQLPSAGMVWAKFEDNSIDFYRLGDCKAFIKRGQRVQEVFPPSTLEELDALSKKKMKEGIQNGLSSIEARHAILPTLRANRSKMNKLNGYGALSLSLDSLNFIEKRTLKVNSGDQILLMTDGFYAQVETYNMITYEKLFSEIEQKKSGVLLKKMRSLELNDKNLHTFTRLKPSDDATSVLLRIKNSYD